MAASRRFPRGRLDDVDLEVRAGTITVLVGANGHGKSLTIRALAGLLPLTGGLRAGSATTGASAIATVLADSWCDPAHTPLLHLTSLAALVGRSQRRADELLEMVGLVDVRLEPIATLSTGMRRRLAVATAELFDPAVLLLDEPSEGLDAEWRGWLMAYLGSKRDAGCGIVLATHDLAFAAGLYDDVKLVRNGRVSHLLARSDDPDEAEDAEARLVRLAETALHR